MALTHVQLSPQLIEAVRDRVDIVTLVSDHTRLSAKGKRHKGLCPFHKEKTPSFSVSPEEGLFYCFGCGAGGDAIKFHMLVSGDDFPGAIEFLARRFGVPLPAPGQAPGGVPRAPDVEKALEAACSWFKEQFLAHDYPRHYWKGRGFVRDVAEQFEVGYAPDQWQALLDHMRPSFDVKDLARVGLIGYSEKSGRHYDRFRHRLIFPIRNTAGRLLGFGGRTLGDDRAKYINTQETERFHKGRILYGLNSARRAIRDRGQVVLAEGYFDVIALAASGVEGAVASMGTALTEDQARLMKRYADEVLVAYDGDEAGEKAFGRSLPILLGVGLVVRRLTLPEDMDPDSYRVEEGPAGLKTLVEKAPDAIERQMDRILPPDPQRSAAERSRLAEEVVELLRPIKDAVMRYHHVLRAAERLAVPPDILWRRTKGGGGRISTPEPEAETPAQSGVIPLEEERVLFELINCLPVTEDEEVVEFPFEEPLPPAVFRDETRRNIYRALIVDWKQGAPRFPCRPRVLAAIEDQPLMMAEWARIVVGERPEGRRGLNQSLRELELRWLRHRRKDVDRLTKETERTGDLKAHENLVVEGIELARRIQKLVADRKGRESIE